MKSIYLIKSLLPLVFLPIAPGVVQIELARQGLVNYGTAVLFAAALQIVFTVGIIGWIAYTGSRRAKKAFLRMSCVSKKVFHADRWMTVETYLSEYHNITVSHGMTPEESNAWIQESEEWLRNNPVEKQAAQEWLRSNAPETPVEREWLEEHESEPVLIESSKAEECLT